MEFHCELPGSVDSRDFYFELDDKGGWDFTAKRFNKTTNQVHNIHCFYRGKYLDTVSVTIEATNEHTYHEYEGINQSAQITKKRKTKANRKRRRNVCNGVGVG